MAKLSDNAKIATVIGGSLLFFIGLPALFGSKAKAKKGKRKELKIAVIGGAYFVKGGMFISAGNVCSRLSEHPRTTRVVIDATAGTQSAIDEVLGCIQELGFEVLIQTRAA